MMNFRKTGAKEVKEEGLKFGVKRKSKDKLK
jgi:hypothetical protein